MTDAKTHRSEPRDRTIRTAKKGGAQDAIGTLEPGCEIFILTFGQFSLIDALVTIVDQTGPADVILSTWTAGNADLTTCERLLERSLVRSIRYIVDRSFLTRQPAYCNKMRELFGDDCIRTMRSHAKFAVVENDEWTLAIRTSMNLNTNPRCENIEISDDPALCALLTQIADDLWEEQDAGDFRGELPDLESIPNVERGGQVSMGMASAERRASVGP